MRADEALRESDVIQYDTNESNVAHMEDGVLMWRGTNTAVEIGTVCDDNWRPWPIKPKCPACKLADKFKKDTEGGFFKDNLTLDVMGSHLHKYHCACKGDK